MNDMQAEPPFLCDYETSRNGYCKHIMTSTAESKHVFKNHKVQKWRWTYNVISAFNWSGIYIYIYFFKYFSGGKSCLVVPGVVILPRATETVLSPPVGG